MVFQKAPFTSKNSNNGSNSKNATTNNKKQTNATTAQTTDIYDDSGGFETSIINNNLRNGTSGHPFNTTSTLSSLVIILQLVKLKRKTTFFGFLNWFSFYILFFGWTFFICCNGWSLKEVFFIVILFVSLHKRIDWKFCNKTVVAGK